MPRKKNQPIISKNRGMKNLTCRSTFAWLIPLSLLLIASMLSCKKGDPSIPEGREGSTIIHGDTIHAVWLEDRDKNCEQELYFHRSTDKGKTWRLETCLSSISPNPGRPTIGISNVAVFVLWRGGTCHDEIYYRRSLNSGQTWEPTQHLNADKPIGQSASIAASDPLIVIVWKDERDGFRKAIYYRRSTDSGETWEPDIRLTLSPEWLLKPNVAVTDKTIHIIWQDIRDGNWEIYYKRSTDGGVTWESDTRLTYEPSLSISPQITSEGPNVRITWEDRRENHLYKFGKRSTDRGNTWGPDSLIGPVYSYIGI